jgi:hypothetical protein
MSKKQHGANRSVLASIHQCQDPTYLNGAGCTRLCQSRKTCRIKRTPFLIQARNYKTTHEKDTVLDGVYVGIYTIEVSAPDEYINEITGAID